MTDAELREQTDKFRKRLAAGETLDDLLIEAFAVCREAGRRVLGMRHFDVQMMGGIVLHRGNIAEMVTGEGKTLVATLPAYLNALEGKGVHVVTVNDYLARHGVDGSFTFAWADSRRVQGYARPSGRRPRVRHLRDEQRFGFDYASNMRPAARATTVIEGIPAGPGAIASRSSTRWTTS